LFRATGERRYLELAARFVEARGRGLLGVGRFGRAYWQDHTPVRDAPTVAGHAVRQLYLDCGAVDVATELGDQVLLDAVLRRWRGSGAVVCVCLLSAPRDAVPQLVAAVPGDRRRARGPAPSVRDG